MHTFFKWSVKNVDISIKLSSNLYAGIQHSEY